MLCTVLRAISGLDAPSGTIVDTSGWRKPNVDGLIAMRYLAPLGPGNHTDVATAPTSSSSPAPVATSGSSRSARQ